MRRQNDNPFQEGLFAPAPANEPPPPKRRSGSNLPKRFRVRVHPFDKFGDYESLKATQEEVDVYLKKLQAWSSIKKSNAILVEKDGVVHEVHSFNDGRWSVERHY